jgi:hypothetical protein
MYGAFVLTEAILKIYVKINSGGNGLFGIPMEAREVTKEDLEALFPTDDVLEKWHKGEDADWPPNMDEVNNVTQQQLRFSEGANVLCRIGPDPVKDWAAGTVVQLWYREPNWPVGSVAPYKIQLDDGRDIFAPADVDQVIRLQPGAAFE